MTELEAAETINRSESLRCPTMKALKECAQWLSYCIKIGWPKSQLDNLESLWWDHHDNYGRFAEKLQAEGTKTQ